MTNWYFASGDLDFFWPEQLVKLSWLPKIFYPEKGFGHNGLLSLWLDYPFRLLLKVLFTFGFSWFFIEKILWLSVFFLAVYSSYTLGKHILQERRFTWLCSFIYATNTYILLLFGGAQLGVAWAYAFFPFVLYRFIKFQKGTPKEQVRNGLCFGLLVLFDLRFAYLMLGALFLSGFRSIVPFIVAASIHLYWILPTVLASRGAASLGEQFTGPGILQFLSVADFSHALSLLHPNWPENLFGKVYFLQPEFLIIPLVAFSALLFKEEKVRFFAVVTIFGAFFAKGVQEPFGEIFLFFFKHVPGFVMFRDPTKFYVFIALGYSILIPFLLSRYKNRIVVWVFVIFWLATLRGIRFQPSNLPHEYVALKNLLVSDQTPSRTLWIPQKENYAFYSDMHPMVATDSAFVWDQEFTQKISEMGVGYVIVPMDINKRIFLNDYQYDSEMRDRLIKKLGEARLIRNPAFRDIAVFENSGGVMKTDIPQEVPRQQKLANIGVAISALVLLFYICILLF